MSLVARPGTTPWKRRLYLPGFRVKEAARYAGISPQTVSYWHRGREGTSATLPGRPPRAALSWMELIEVAIVAVMRQSGLSLQKIRRAREYAAQHLSSEYPFADYEFKTDGQGILLELDQVEPIGGKDKIIICDQDGQLAWKQIIKRRFETFDYQDDLVVRWHPAGRNSPILMDPRIGFGAPTVHGTPTWAIKGRYEAGETIDDIASDFEIEEPDVRIALEFEGENRIPIH